MEKSYYSAESLRRALDAFEQRYGISSVDFYDAYVDCNASRMEHISGFHRHSWAGFYRDWRPMSGDDFASTVERALETAWTQSSDPYALLGVDVWTYFEQSDTRAA